VSLTEFFEKHSFTEVENSLMLLIAIQDGYGATGLLQILPAVML
jgi:hypothetical protein